MTRFKKALATAGTVAVLATPVAAADTGKFVPGVTDFPSADRAERFVPGVTDFPSVKRTDTSYHVVVRAARRPVAAPPVVRDGFAWADAGIGAAVGAAAAALGLASTLVLRRRFTGAHA